MIVYEGGHLRPVYGELCFIGRFQLSHASQNRSTAKRRFLVNPFFPKIPDADLSDIADAVYPEQLPFPKIPRHEIECVIRSTPPNKAPSEDIILNSF